MTLLDTARSRPEWTVAYHATVLENETGMRGVEVRKSATEAHRSGRWRDPPATEQTKGGVRTIPLSQDAQHAVSALIERARLFGACEPDHYLIPALVVTTGDDGVRIRHYDPTKPTKGRRTAWRKLTVRAGLKGLRGHDLRHTAANTPADQFIALE